MKKLLTYILLGVALMITSCNLDKHPVGTIDSSNAISSVNDAKSMKNYLYVGIRSIYSGSRIYSMELSADVFNAAQGYGNRGGDLYKWTWDASNSTLQGSWQTPYSLISTAYFLIEGIERIDKSNLTEKEVKSLELYTSEAHFAIALCYAIMAERYCQIYDPATAENALGLSLVDHYEPTSDSGKYPARSSLKDTYIRIAEHVAKAKLALNDVKGTPDSENFTTDAVTAFEARIALWKQDWDTAIEKSTSLINSGTYALISDATAYKNMWINDEGGENIVQMYAIKDPASLPNANGTYYINYTVSNKQYSPDFVPTKWIIDLYDKDNDIRFDAYFQNQTLTYASVTVSEKAYICTKFPGNPTLYSGSSNYVNKVKLFRIAEQYLIAAEAYYNKGNNEAAAATILNQLKVKRIKDFDDQILLSGENLKNEIRNERVRELFAEGYRLLDIRRYNQDLKRTEGQNSLITYLSGDESTEFLSKTKTDFRFIFPIPQAEMDANPQLKGQQNPGY